MDTETRKDVVAQIGEFLAGLIPPGACMAALPENVVDEVVEHLKQEADRHWGIDPNFSLEYANRIVEIGQARQDPRKVALGLMAQGDALKYLGRTTEAWEVLDRAGQMFQSAGDEIGWARTRIGMLYLSTMLNRVPSALAEAARAEDILIRYDEQEKLLRLEFQIAYVLNYLGDQPGAIGRYQSALGIAERLGKAGEGYYGPLYTNLGSAYENLGNLRQALDYYERAQAFFLSRGETFFLATVETNIAYIAHAQGDYRKAIRLFDRSLSQVTDRSALETAKIKHDMLECYLELNRLQEAHVLAQEIIDSYRQWSDAFELARALLHQATIEARLANYDNAHTALDEAESIFTSLGATAWMGTVFLRRGRIALKQNNLSFAYQLAQEATEVFELAGQQVNQATARLLEGQVLLDLGDFQEGSEAGSRTLQVARQDNVPSLRYSAHLLLGQISEKQNQVKRAERHYRAATAITERIQRDLTITLQPGFLEDKTGAWRLLIGLQIRSGQIESAFETLERSKSQVLLGYLANRERLRWAQEDESSRALIEELDELRAEHQWFYHLAHENSPGLHPGTSMDHEQALAEVKAREHRMRSITEKLYIKSADIHAGSSTQTPSVLDIQRKLDERSLLIEFYNDGIDMFAFVLDEKSIEFHRLPITLENTNSLLAKLQVNLTAALQLDPQAPANANLAILVKRILQQLYNSLLEPLALSHRNKLRLVIVPYGPLHFLPFHLMYDGSKYIIERYEVVVLPAAGLSKETGPKRNPGAVIVAHSWDGKLPFTLQEAEVVQRIFGGELYANQDANRSVFSTAPTQIMHIAAHGQHRLDQPDLSFIQLADGQLYADDLLQQDLSYELVTLSACETARANVAGGDELIGLGRGFLYAGAGALISSLWKIEDSTTVRLIETMYKALQKGESKAAALRAAQLSILEEMGWLHPAFWGAFQLLGDASPLSKV